MEISNILSKLEELNTKLDALKNFDYEAKNIKNVGNVVMDFNNNPLKVNYAKNATTINNKTYDEFTAEIKAYLAPLVKDIKETLLKENNEKTLSASYIKDWTDLEIDKTKNIQVIAIDTLDFIPSYLEILVKVNECSEKNGGSNNTFTQIPPIGVSIDGIPFSTDISKVKNFSGWWIEDNQIKVFFKKTDFPQWVGKCNSMKFKIMAWR